MCGSTKEMFEDLYWIGDSEKRDDRSSSKIGVTTTFATSLRFTTPHR